MTGGADAPPPGRKRPWIALSLEDVLLDQRAATLWVIHALSGAEPADVALFEATGEYGSPWEIARAAHTWVRARRPRPIAEGGWRVMVNQCGGDPGDLTAKAARLYDQLGWRHERPLVDIPTLTRLSELANLVVVTTRDRVGLSRGEELIGLRFEHTTTSEDAIFPDPTVLHRHNATGHFVGRGAAARATAEAARYVFHEVEDAPGPVVARLLARLEAPTARATVFEPSGT